MSFFLPNNSAWSLNFADQTGCDALTIVAPHIENDKVIKYLKSFMRFFSSFPDY